MRSRRLQAFSETPSRSAGGSSGVGAGIVCAALVGWLGCSGGQECTLIGCPTPVLVELEPRLLDGEYVVTVTSGNESARCELITEGSQSTGGCSGSLDALVSGVTVELLENVDSLQITIAQGEQTIVDEEITPTYEVSYPNGRDCGRCVSARETLTWTP